VQLHTLEHGFRHRVVGEERAVVGVEDWVEAFGVQIRHLDVVSRGVESCREAIENGTTD
jgi:hypothetical protein